MIEHYSGPLGRIIEGLAIDDLVRESRRDPFMLEIGRRKDRATADLERAKYALQRIECAIEDAEKRHGDEP